MLLAAVVALFALVIGVGLGVGLAPRLLERRQRRAVEQSGITVSQMLEHIVSGSPVGIVVVDTYRDVVYTMTGPASWGWSVTACSTTGPGWPPSARWRPARAARSTCRRASVPTPAAPGCRCAGTYSC